MPPCEHCGTNDHVVPVGNTVDKKLTFTQHSTKVVGHCSRQFLCHFEGCPEVKRKVSNKRPVPLRLLRRLPLLLPY